MNFNSVGGMGIMFLSNTGEASLNRLGLDRDDQLIAPETRGEDSMGQIVVAGHVHNHGGIRSVRLIRANGFRNHEEGICQQVAGIFLLRADGRGREEYIEDDSDSSMGQFRQVERIDSGSKTLYKHKGEIVEQRTARREHLGPYVQLDW